MKSTGLALSAIALAAIAVTGCSKELAQPMPGETPASTAGQPPTPRNWPNAAAPNATSTLSDQTRGYSPYVGTPLTPPNTSMR